MRLMGLDWVEEKERRTRSAESGSHPTASVRFDQHGLSISLHSLRTSRQPAGYNTRQSTQGENLTSLAVRAPALSADLVHLPPLACLAIRRHSMAAKGQTLI